MVDLIGRGRELDALGECLVMAGGGSPQVVLVEGAAGVGKSALLSAFGASQVGLSPVAVAGDETEGGLRFGLVDQIVGDRPGREDSRDSFTAGAALLRLLGGWQARGPAILLVDDAHLVDAESLQAMTFALRRLRVDRVLSVFAVRTDGVGRLPAGLVRLADDRGARLVLSGLGDAGVIELGVAMGCGRLPRRAAARLCRHTSGSPLHLRALMRELPVEELRAADGPMPAPRSFALLVISALAQTSAAARRLAGAAAVLGDRAGLADVALVAGVADPLPGFEELHDARILRLAAGGGGWRVEFDHPLVRAAVYDDLGPATRARMHVRAADMFRDGRALAHRVAAATPPDPDLAAELVRASEEHRCTGSWHAAAVALLDAARFARPGEAADRLLLDGVEQLLLAGDVAAALAFTDRIAGLQTSAHGLQVQARMAWLTGQFTESDLLARAAWARTDELQPAQRADVAAMLAQLCLMRDEGSGATEWAHRALDSGLPADQGGTVRAAGAMGLMISGRAVDGLRLMAGLPADPSLVEGECQDELNSRGSLRLWTDDLPGARADLRVAGSTAHRGTSPYRLAALAYLAETDYRLGDWDSSLAIAEQAVSLVEDMEQDWLLSLVHAAAVLVSAARGDWVLAERHVGAAQATADTMDLPANRAYADNAAVHLAACQADSDHVIQKATPLLAVPHGARHEPGMFSWPVQYAAALVDVHRFEEAAETLDALERVARDRQRRSRLAGVARVRGELAAALRQTRAARQAFDAALSLGDAADALERATAHAAYGRFLRRRGERRAAAHQLQTARGGFERLGARPFLDRCDVELAACGLTPGRRSASYSAQLTPQEQAVARLVCTGRTNQQVADELVLSVKTVDYHLAHVYTKLGVHSRTQLMARTARATEGSTTTRPTRPDHGADAPPGGKPGNIPEARPHQPA